MGGVKGTRYLLSIHFCNIRTQKMSKLKIKKKVIKYYFRILKNPLAYFQAILKAHVKFLKDRLKTMGGVKGTKYLLPIDFCNIRTKKCPSSKCVKSDKNNFRILKKKHMHIFRPSFKHL